jgi:hypothetical protein
MWSATLAASLLAAVQTMMPNQAAKPPAATAVLGGRVLDGETRTVKPGEQKTFDFKIGG